MLPRKKLDIDWMDLAYALATCLFPRNREAAHDRLEAAWSSNNDALATLSVRSGLDLLLRCLSLPPDSEILVSAITIPDMVHIIEHHGLRAVPVDIDPDTCSMRRDLLAKAITPRSRGILIAHLFGSRMDMADIVVMAKEAGLLVIEDCAQAYAADGYRGHPASDVSMFSFGPIKTATALGGALLSFRDPNLRNALKQRQREYPAQRERVFLRKVVKYSLLKTLSYRLPYSIFVAACRLFHTTHDRIIGRAVRSFAGGDLTRKIRCQPCGALLALLHRRLRRYRSDRITRRIEAATAVASQLADVPVVGRRAENHSHWVLPIQSRHPDELVRSLWKQGFDATRGASNLYAVPAADGSRADLSGAGRAIAQIVYLPFDAGASAADLQRLTQAVLHFEAERAGPHAGPAID